MVVLAIIDFDFRFQRPQQIAAQFARNGHRVFWISATRVIPADSPEPYRLVPLRKNIWELHLRAPQIDPYQSPMPPSAARIFVEGILEFYRDWGVSATAILAQLPFWRGVAVGLRAEGSAFSCTIALTIGTSSKHGAFNRSEEQRLARECDLLVVTAAGLREKFLSRGLHPLLVRNGADFEFFHTAEPLPEIAGIPGPVIGYFGAIADWIDLDLVYEALARGRAIRLCWPARFSIATFPPCIRCSTSTCWEGGLTSRCRGCSRRSTSASFRSS